MDGFSYLHGPLNFEFYQFAHDICHEEISIRFFLFFCVCIFLTNWQVAVKSYDTKYFPVGGEKKQTKGDKHTTLF